MKSITLLFAFSLLTIMTCFAQVGINTENPDASSALDISSTTGGLLPPRMNTTERDALDNDPMTAGLTVTEGLTVYNTDTQSLEIYTGSNWVALAPNEGPKALTMYRTKDTGDITINGSGVFALFPLGSSQVTETNSDIYTVNNNGTITFNEAGVYQINASWSVENMPDNGSSKYIFAVFLDEDNDNVLDSGNGQDNRLGYLARGFATLPDIAGRESDFFGASGTFQYEFSANDTIFIAYFAATGGTLRGDLFHIGIEKM